VIKLKIEIEIDNCLGKRTYYLNIYDDNGELDRQDIVYTKKDLFEILNYGIGE
jgi:hypothetical protein